MIAQDFIRAARALIGTPFLHQGRIPSVGLDCVGVVIVALQAVGVTVRDSAGYAMTPAHGLLQAAIDGNADILRRVSNWLPGDILLMRFVREPQHVAILTERDTIIHSYGIVGQVCEHRCDALWRKRALAAYRVVGS